MIVCYLKKDGKVVAKGLLKDRWTPEEFEALRECPPKALGWPEFDEVTYDGD